MPALTVNVTCVDCSGDPPCAVCRAAARAITASGHRVEHTSRYAALRAAASGTYGFDACVVQIGPNERAVADAVRALLPSQCVALVAEDREAIGHDLPPNYIFVSVNDYRNGHLPPEWLWAAAPSRSARDRRHRADETSPLAARRVAALAARARIASAAPGSRFAVDPDMALDDQIAWAAACSAPFAIVLIRLPGLCERSGASADQSRQTFDAAARIIASEVRQGDVIAARRDEFLLALPEADAAGAAGVAARIAGAVARAPFAARLPSKKSPGAAGWTIGVAAYPSHGDTRAALLTRATEKSKALV